jgi:hypothetical protein
VAFATVLLTHAAIQIHRNNGQSRFGHSLPAK